MTPEQANKTLLTTDASLDKIIYMDSGSISVPVTFSGSTAIPHGLGFIPLPLILWSNTPDFTTTYTDNDADMNLRRLDGSGMIIGQSYTITANSTDITIGHYNNSGSTQTVYYRIYCFAPSTLDPDTLIEHTASIADNFVINTDYNYMKLASTGSLDSVTPSFTHDLGYVPTVMIWGLQFDGTSTPTVGGQISPTYPAFDYRIDVSATDITWTGAGTNFNNIEYRIYTDGGIA